MRHTIGIDTIERIYRRRAVVAVTRIAQGFWEAPAVIGLWLWYRLLVWQSRADSRRRLAAQDTRMLNDMGITREAAEREVNKPFWRA